MSDNDYERFRALIADFAAEAGLVMQDDSLGIEFEVEGHVTLIVPDPRKTTRMLVDVSVLTLPDAPADLLRVLHQLNHAARIEHDWVITVDAADRLCLHTKCEIAASKVSVLSGNDVLLFSDGDGRVVSEGDGARE
jgi:hypothetical protein